MAAQDSTVYLGNPHPGAEGFEWVAVRHCDRLGRVRIMPACAGCQAEVLRRVDPVSSVGALRRRLNHVRFAVHGYQPPAHTHTKNRVTDFK